ncbi:hypothetical protein Tco_0768969 [Tanacetum coccineum]|uniref:Uncharacterized protein n=1 Tax=Tanacetum coccineum TaxID=301880 RepID=A0ABQ4ZBV7_9ASTR
MPTEMELTLEQTQQGVSYEVSVLSDIEDSHGPSDAMHKPLPAQSQKDFVSKLTEIHSFLLTFSLRLVSSHNGYQVISLEVYARILVIFQNVRVNSFTLKIGNLAEQHQKSSWGKGYQDQRFNTTAGNPVKKILLKLNLSDHRIFKDGDGDFRYSDTTHLSGSVEVLKLKNFKKDATLKFFKNGLRFLNFFNDPRIIRDQRITAYGFERGDRVVRVRMSAQDPYLYLLEVKRSKQALVSGLDT